MFKLASVAVVSAVVAFAPVNANAGVNIFNRSKAKPAASTHASKQQLKRVSKDVQRLESILAETKTSAKISDKAWKKSRERSERPCSAHSRERSLNQ